MSVAQHAPHALVRDRVTGRLQQAAIRTMRSLREQGASLRRIAVAMSVAGHAISHEGVASVPRNGHAVP